MELLKKLVVAGIYYGYFATIFLAMGGYLYYWDNYEKNPEQPINFSHNIHVHKLGLDCTYCHVSVEKSKRASVPQAETCMTCHAQVATDRPEIMKLTKYYEEGEFIPWKQVHKLPDFVYFSHKRHIKAGIECTECHGNISMMGVARKVRTLKMGWCMSCHYENNAPVDCWTCHK